MSTKIPRFLGMRGGKSDALARKACADWSARWPWSGSDAYELYQRLRLREDQVIVPRFIRTLELAAELASRRVMGLRQAFFYLWGLGDQSDEI